MKKQKNNHRSLNIVFGILIIIMAVALGYCVANIKSDSDKEYLALQDHLLNRFVVLSYQKENQYCQMESHGLSENHEVFVRFWCQNYDGNTNEPVGEKEYHTAYFQRPSTIQGGITGYGEALGD